MRFYRMKCLSIFFLFLAVFSQQYLYASWTDWFNPYSALFQKEVKPILKDPKTYVVAAIVLTGACFVVTEFYWSWQPALPFKRAQSYVRSIFGATIANADHVQQLCNFVYQDLNLQNEPADEKICFPKKDMEDRCNYYLLRYEFHKDEEQPFRDVENDQDVKIHSRNSLVCHQSGNTCGFHAAYNASKVFNYLVGNDDLNLLTDLRNGPDIAQLTTQLNQAMENKIIPEDSLANQWTDDKGVGYLLSEGFNIKQENYSVLPHLLDMNANNLVALSESFKNAIVKLQKQDACHAFVLGSMRHVGGTESEALKGTSGHWIAVVVRRKKSVLELFVMDSIASWSGRAELLNHFKTLLIADASAGAAGSSS